MHCPIASSLYALCCVFARVTLLSFPQHCCVALSYHLSFFFNSGFVIMPHLYLSCPTISIHHTLGDSPCAVFSPPAFDSLLGFGITRFSPLHTLSHHLPFVIHFNFAPAHSCRWDLTVVSRRLIDPSTHSQHTSHDTIFPSAVVGNDPHRWLRRWLSFSSTFAAPIRPSSVH
jgi:hypothetical protein